MKPISNIHIFLQKKQTEKKRNESDKDHEISNSSLFIQLVAVKHEFLIGNIILYVNSLGINLYGSIPFRLISVQLGFFLFDSIGLIQTRISKRDAILPIPISGATRFIRKIDNFPGRALFKKERYQITIHQMKSHKALLTQPCIQSVEHERWVNTKFTDVFHFGILFEFFRPCRPRIRLFQLIAPLSIKNPDPRGSTSSALLPSPRREQAPALRVL